MRIEVFLDQELPSRTAVYRFMAQQLAGGGLTEEAVVSGFLAREKIGSIAIADQVVLPHLEHEAAEQGLFIVRLHKAIDSWSPSVGKVRLVIALLLSKKGPKEEKVVIQQFVRKLALADFIQFLLSEKDSRRILEEIDGY